MARPLRYALASAASLSFVLAGGVALGDGINPPKPSLVQDLPKAGGNVKTDQDNDDQGRPRFVSDELSLTSNMAPIDLPAKTQAMFKYNFAKGPSHTFAVPPTIKDSTGATVDVTDYHHNFTTFSYSYAPSPVNVEAYAFNTATSTFSGLPVFGTIAALYGYNNWLEYPILGSPNAPTLTEYVVANYLGSFPALTSGETFTFTDGTSAALTGILLSTTPFGFDATNGPTGEGFTGTVTVVGIDAVEAVPEPAGLALLALGVGVGSVSARRALARARRARPPVDPHLAPGPRS